MKSIDIVQILYQFGILNIPTHDSAPKVIILKNSTVLLLDSQEVMIGQEHVLNWASCYSTTSCSLQDQYFYTKPGGSLPDLRAVFFVPSQKESEYQTHLVLTN